MLLPWNVAAAAAVCLALAAASTRRAPAAWAQLCRILARETAIVLALYAFWMRASGYVVTRSAGAVAHARWIWDVERSFRLPSEVTVQHLVLGHPILVQGLNEFYAIVHVPALLVFLVWLFFRHRERYSQWRNVIALFTGAALLIQMIPVAPPRMLPSLGFVDTAAAYGQSVYGHGGLKIAPDVAAMPSVHVGWAVLIAVAVVATSTSRWRWWIVVHPVVTVFAVVATANHWWFDGIVAVAILAAAMQVEAWARSLAGRARDEGGPATSLVAPAGLPTP